MYLNVLSLGIWRIRKFPVEKSAIDQASTTCSTYSQRSIFPLSSRNIRNTFIKINETFLSLTLLLHDLLIIFPSTILKIYVK